MSEQLQRWKYKTKHHQTYKKNIIDQNCFKFLDTTYMQSEGLMTAHAECSNAAEL